MYACLMICDQSSGAGSNYVSRDASLHDAKFSRAAGYAKRAGTLQRFSSPAVSQGPAAGWPSGDRFGSVKPKPTALRQSRVFRTTEAAERPLRRRKSGTFVQRGSATTDLFSTIEESESFPANDLGHRRRQALVKTSNRTGLVSGITGNPLPDQLSR